MKLHIGCGQRNFGGDWVHIDGGEFEHVVHHDVTLEHFLPEQADTIFCSHMIEYFDREEGLKLLKQWYQILKPGGSLRLAVPDFEALSYAYETADFKLSDILGPLYGRMEMNGRHIYHRTCYDYDSLHDLLTEAGFKNIHKYDWRQTEHAHIDDHSHAHLPHDIAAIRTGNFTDKHILISLNVEATK